MIAEMTRLKEDLKAKDGKIAILKKRLALYNVLKKNFDRKKKEKRRNGLKLNPLAQPSVSDWPYGVSAPFCRTLDSG